MNSTTTTWLRRSLLVCALCACSELTPRQPPTESKHPETGTDPQQIDASQAVPSRSLSLDAATRSTEPVPEPADATVEDPSQSIDAALVDPVDASDDVPGDASVPPARAAPDGGAGDAAAYDAWVTDASGEDRGGPGAAGAVTVEQILDNDQMPFSENGVYTDSGRFFVVGGPVLYEVTGGPDRFEAHELLRDDDCLLNGLVDRGDTLYIACTRADTPRPDLIRLDPTDSAQPELRRVAFPEIAEPILLNGMEFGPDGALYISNSGAPLSGAPALYRVEILEEDPLAIEVTPMIEAVDDLMPNGLRFDGDHLYFSTGESVTRMRLHPDGRLGEPEVVFTTDGVGVVDDFDLVDGRLFLARTDTADTLSVLAFGAGAGSPFGSPLVITDLEGELEREVELDVIPSSTAVRRDTFFGDATVIVTSVFNGGLYRVEGAY